MSLSVLHTMDIQNGEYIQHSQVAEGVSEKLWAAFATSYRTNASCIPKGLSSKVLELLSLYKGLRCSGSLSLR